jgi:hypothetical protein
MNFNQTISMALGMFIGLFFIHGVFQREWLKGLFIGSVSAVFFIIAMVILNYFGIK